MKKIMIKNKQLSEDWPVFFVAEIGINHNGNIDTAKELIDLASFCKCDAVKFQMRTIPLVYSEDELKTARPTPFGKTNGHLKNQLEFLEDDYKKIDSYCKNRGIMWTASPWDVSSLYRLMKFNPPFIKIASANVTDLILLLEACGTKKPFKKALVIACPSTAQVIP